MARRAVENALRGAPDMLADTAVQKRVAELVNEAQVTLAAIQTLAGTDVPDPLTDPYTLAQALKRGILDAPQLRNNRFARGELRVAILNGACVAIDGNGRVIGEAARLEGLTRKE